MAVGELPWSDGRMGWPEAPAYVHPGWTGGVPSRADNPVRNGVCRKCDHTPASRHHKIACLGQAPPPAPDSELCGTPKGYRRHLALGTVADEDCLVAWALHGRLERAKGDPAQCQVCGFKLGSNRCVAWHAGPG